MRLRLGINDCFAVKRWPRPDDWAPIVRDRLGLRARPALASTWWTSTRDGAADDAGGGREAAAHGLELHSTFTGLAAYSSNLLLHPDAAARDGGGGLVSRAIAWTRRAGGVATGGHVGAFSVPDWPRPRRRAAALGGPAGGARRAGRATRGPAGSST